MSSNIPHPDDVAMRQYLMTAIRTIAKRLGLTQAAIAARVHTRQSAISNLLAGKVDPRLSTVQRLVRAVGGGYRFEIWAGFGNVVIDAPASGGHWVYTPDVLATAYATRHINYSRVTVRAVVVGSAHDELREEALALSRAHAAPGPFTHTRVEVARFTHPADDHFSVGQARTLELVEHVRRRPLPFVI